MNRQSLTRRLVYVGVLLAMLVPLFLLGQPSADGRGGALTTMRDDYDISEADLGELDPSSEAMKLASFGLRGVAATALWGKTRQFEVQHEWDRHRAAVDQLVKLQPHFDRVWEYQAHNLAYNVSREFDDYRQRYRTVRDGTEFLIDGVRRNDKATRLIWYTGWFYGQKIGVSDEKRQFRKLFADDEVAHQQLLDENINVDSPEARGPDGKPDNWLVGRLWSNFGYDLVDSGVAITRQTPVNFFEQGPKWRMRHAEAIEAEGVLDERAIGAWQAADESWKRFGQRSIPTTANFTIKLDQLDDLKAERLAKYAEFEELVGEDYRAAREQALASAGPQSKRLLASDPEDLNSVERELREKSQLQLFPPPTDFVPSAAPGDRLKAVALATEIEDLGDRIQKTDGHRIQINYVYWKTLAQAEKEDRTVTARRKIYDAEAAYKRADLDRAIELYEEGFDLWAQIFEDYPVLTTDETAIDLYESIGRYQVAIDSEDLSDDFPLADFVDIYNETMGQIPPNLYAETLSRQEDLSSDRTEELRREEDRRRRDADLAVEAGETADPSTGGENESVEGSDSTVSPEDSEDYVEGSPGVEGSDDASVQTEAPNDSAGDAPMFDSGEESSQPEGVGGTDDSGDPVDDAAGVVDEAEGDATDGTDAPVAAAVGEVNVSESPRD